MVGGGIDVGSHLHCITTVSLSFPIDEMGAVTVVLLHEVVGGSH